MPYYWSYTRVYFYIRDLFDSYNCLNSTQEYKESKCVEVLKTKKSHQRLHTYRAGPEGQLLPTIYLYVFPYTQDLKKWIIVSCFSSNWYQFQQRVCNTNRRRLLSVSLTSWRSRLSVKMSANHCVGLINHKFSMDSKYILLMLNLTN